MGEWIKKAKKRQTKTPFKVLQKLIIVEEPQ